MIAQERKKIYKSPISSYKRNKKNLSPPLGFISNQIFFHRDILPELLWLESLTNYYGEFAAHSLFNHFADKFDEYYRPSKKHFFDGSISSFTLIYGSNRDTFKEENKIIIKEAIVAPFKEVLKLYPKMPMNWLIEKSDINKQPSSEGIDLVRSIIKRLYPAKDDYTGNIRAMPLNRIFKWGDIHITNTMVDIIKAIEEYPRGDRYRLQSFARNVYNMYPQNYLKDKIWSEYFWNYNYLLVNKCNE